MITNIINFARSGLADWVIQRLSAVLLAAYTLCLVSVFLLNPELDYARWQMLHGHTAMRLFSLITLLALCAHAWIGMWTIATDYLNTHQLGRFATALRLAFQTGCALLILVYLLWGISILWRL
ncbi:MAG: succinate dehydrogenase, hydrophobic membrane anchor protein [Pseudohongiellaceae bacterium]